MIIAFVKFKIPSELDDNILKEKFLETAPIYKDTEGLIRKNYISDTEKNIAGVVSQVLILGSIDKDGKVILVHPSHKSNNGLPIA